MHAYVYICNIYRFNFKVPRSVYVDAIIRILRATHVSSSRVYSLCNTGTYRFSKQRYITLRGMNSREENFGTCASMRSVFYNDFMVTKISNGGFFSYGYKFVILSTDSLKLKSQSKTFQCYLCHRTLSIHDLTANDDVRYLHEVYVPMCLFLCVQ